MRVRTHLLAMPWTHPLSVSVQIACLKAHLDTVLRQRSDCHAYSAFFSILHGFKGAAFLRFFDATEPYGEYVYQLLYLRRFGPPAFRRATAVRRALGALRLPRVAPLSLSVLDGLERATCRYLDRRVGPNLIDEGLNVVGFTVNYHQLYAAVYAAEHLRRRFPGRDFLFVYGGGSVSLPHVYDLLTQLDIPGVIVIGEGEKKLELLVRTCQDLPRSRADTALAAVAGLDAGVVVIGEKVDLLARHPAHYASQVESLSELPVPDYDDYFAAARQACAGEQAYAAFRAVSEVVVEGSRGCFAACDFCALNRMWHGFRKRPADDVVRATLALTLKHRTSRVMFVDSVCDTWAADYARALLHEGIHQRSFMELRPHHPESFWTLLSLAGLTAVQVGVEALSSPLLRAIGKGTTVIQNLRTQKYLAELGILRNNHLITHHPASTLADVRETHRILDQIPHWGPFLPTPFLLMAGSPLYEQLSHDERARLRPIRTVRLPRAASRYAVEYSFAVPERLSPGREVMRAWSALSRRYEGQQARHAKERPRLDVVRVAPEVLRITDTRGGTIVCHNLLDGAARIYDACHAGLRLGEIVEVTRLPAGAVKVELSRLLRSRLVLRVDDWYLSLATRPRDELLLRSLASLQLGRPQILPRLPQQRDAVRPADADGIPRVQRAEVTAPTLGARHGRPDVTPQRVDGP